MSSAWLLPEHIADVLPAQARRIEEFRRVWLDVARSYGYELVMPPLLEHLDSLLSGTGRELDLRTFKLVDQLSGRTLGIRADATPQVARIDAHLLNRGSVTRLCYCGPVLHTKPASPHASREPLQFGAEIYGHAGIEADLEVQELALEGLKATGVANLVIDLSDVRLFDGVLAALEVDRTISAAKRDQLLTALATKDASTLRDLAAEWGQASVNALVQLTKLFGDQSVLAHARVVLPQHELIDAALTDLDQLANQLRSAFPEVRIGFDLSDLSGYAYYSGTRFAIYGVGHADALIRGGRYDEVGAVFGRRRPAVGFGLDLKVMAEWMSAMSVPQTRSAIRAPWGEGAALKFAVRQLRQSGETVVRVLPGHEHEVEEFDCDRELSLIDGQWVVRPL